jgi:type I restriction enzyme, R subunit
MSAVGLPERATQRRLVALFRDELRYRNLGDWAHREGNNNVDAGLLSAWLARRGYTPAQIGVAIHKLRTEADHPGRALYDNNRAVYALLRYGVQVKTAAGEVTETVHLVDW